MSLHGVGLLLKFCSTLGNYIEQGQTEFMTSSSEHCKVVSIPHTRLYPHKDTKVILSVSDPKATVAPAVWTRRVTYKEVEVCVRRRRSESNGRRFHVEWLLYQDAPTGTRAGSITMRPFGAGTVCQRVSTLVCIHYYCINYKIVAAVLVNSLVYMIYSNSTLRENQLFWLL